MADFVWNGGRFAPERRAIYSGIRNQKPSLILMDILLPKLDGISACYILKSDANTRAIPVVVISGRTDKLDQDYSKAIGADDFLTKPFDIQDLLDKINKY